MSTTATEQLEVEVVQCVEESDHERGLNAVPSMRVASSFLDKNSQSHASALTAFGDVIDNCRESNASLLKIEVRTHRGRNLLVVSDNGCGMTEAKVREGLMSIGFTSKDLSTGKHYGFGGKTAIPRIADSCLIFTREDSTRFRTVGLLSTVFSEKAGATETKMPLASWEEHGFNLVGSTMQEVAPLSLHQREASLHYMLETEGCPYPDAKALLQEFERDWGFGPDGQGLAGTRLIMWGIKKDINLKPHVPNDVLVQGPANAANHSRSLRSFCEVLYLKVGDKEVPTMNIELRKVPVEYRDWETYLSDMSTEYLLPKPNPADVAAQFKAEATTPASQTCASEASAFVTMGYARSMQSLVSVLSSRGQQSTLDLDDEEDDEKLKATREETGFFIYHKGRMTRALEKVKLMTKMTGANITSKMRITTLGVGLTGFIKESFLVQTHNKAGYLDSRLFDTLLSHVNLKAKDFLRRYTSPAHGRIMGYVPEGMPEAEAPARQPSADARKEKEKPVILDEEVRMRPINPNDPTVGRVVKAPFSGGRYRLRLPDFTLSERTYLARDLVRTWFNPDTDLQGGMKAAPASLAGCTADVWWLPDSPEDSGGFFNATLHPAEPELGLGDGWFKFVYEVDGFSEYFFIALKPGDATIFAAYRDDGEKLPGGIEFRFASSAIPKVAAAAAELLRPPKPRAAASTASTTNSLLPAVNTLRFGIYENICQGRMERDDIVRKLRGAGWRREDTVTCLGREKRSKVPLWLQEGSTYHLTHNGRECARLAGYGLDATTDMQPGAEVLHRGGEVEEGAEIEVEIEVADIEVEDVEMEDFEEIHEVSVINAAPSAISAGSDAALEAANLTASAETHASPVAVQSASRLPLIPAPSRHSAAEPETDDSVIEVAVQQNSSASSQHTEALLPPPSAESELTAAKAVAPDADSSPALCAAMRVKAKYLASLGPHFRGRNGYGPGRWYEGTIRSVEADGTCSIDYDDGDFEASVLPKYIVPLADEARSAPGSSSGNGQLAATRDADVPGIRPSRVTRRVEDPVASSSWSNDSLVAVTTHSLGNVAAETSVPVARQTADLKEELSVAKRNEAALRSELVDVMQTIVALHGRGGHYDEGAARALAQRAERYLENEAENAHALLPPASSSMNLTLSGSTIATDSMGILEVDELDTGVQSLKDVDELTRSHGNPKKRKEVPTTTPGKARGNKSRKR